MRKERKFKFSSYEEALSNLIKNRFWKFVDKNTKSGCWEWIGASDKHGYGLIQLYYAKKRKYFRAHQLSLIISGIKIPENTEVCHNCPIKDNPRCVNPSHLFLGTHKQNMEDMSRKGRSPSGMKSGQAILGEQDIKNIFYQYSLGIKLTKIAKSVGVQERVVSNLLFGKTYKKEVEDLGLEKQAPKVRKLTTIELEYARRLRSSGISYDKVSRLLRVSSTTMHKRIKEFKTEKIENAN